jgi:hypothetical protein
MTDNERIGRRFGRLEVVGIRRERRGKRNMLVAHCRCDCGREKDVDWCNLARGGTKSCGCLSRELTAKHGLLAEDNRVRMTVHGGHGTRLYRIWTGMKRRCYNRNDKDFTSYGGRGIKVCPEWRGNFAAFREWATSHGYADNLSIDRIDNDRGYSPDNCRWVDTGAQQNNRRICHHVTAAGRTHTIAEWSRLTGIDANTIGGRLRRGWSAERALGVSA